MTPLKMKQYHQDNSLTFTFLLFTEENNNINHTDLSSRRKIEPRPDLKLNQSDQRMKHKAIIKSPAVALQPEPWACWLAFWAHPWRNSPASQPLGIRNNKIQQEKSRQRWQWRVQHSVIRRSWKICAPSHHHHQELALVFNSSSFFLLRRESWSAGINMYNNSASLILRRLIHIKYSKGITSNFIIILLPPIMFLRFLVKIHFLSLNFKNWRFSLYILENDSKSTLILNYRVDV